MKCWKISRKGLLGLDDSARVDPIGEDAHGQAEII